MKKYLIILLTLFSLSASAQVKVIKVQGVGGSDGGISESKVAQMISDSLATLDLSGYTKAQVDSIATVIRGEITGKVDKTTTITINGVTYDLSEDRTWTVSGGESSPTLYTADDSLTGDRTVDVKNHNLTFKSDLYPNGWLNYIPSLGDFGNVIFLGDGFGNQNNTNISILDSLKNVHINAGNGVIYNTPPSGASTDSILTWDDATGIIRKRDVSSFSIGGVTQTQLDDTATAIRGAIPDTSNLVKKNTYFPLGLIAPLVPKDSFTIRLDSLNLPPLRYSLTNRKIDTDTSLTDKKYVDSSIATVSSSSGVSQSVISDTLKNYANSGSITTPNVLFTTPVSLSVSNHQLTGTLALNSQSAYRLFGTGSSSGMPSFLSSIDSNLVTGLHSEAYYNTKYLGSSLPSQTGNSGKWLTTNGTSASWANLTGWGTSGNTVSDSSRVIGTLNAFPFSFIINNIKVARFDSTGMYVGDLSGATNSLYSKITGESVTFTKSGSYAAVMRFDQAGWTGSAGGVNVKKSGALQDVYGATVWANAIKSSSTTQYGGLTIQSSAYPGTNVESIVFNNTFSTSPKRIIIYGGSAGTFPVSIIPGGDGELLVGKDASGSVASSMMTVVSTTKGAIPAPKMTSTQWNAISSPSEGLQGWSTTDHAQFWYDGTSTVGFRYNHSTSKFQGTADGGSTWVDLN